jgi:hypothetical protein
MTVLRFQALTDLTQPNLLSLIDDDFACLPLGFYIRHTSTTFPLYTIQQVHRNRPEAAADRFHVRG